MKDKCVLISGGTGSLAQALVPKILALDPRKVIIYSRGEHLQEEMARKFPDRRMRFFIGDVRDKPRLESAMRGVDVVIHTAALKIVPSLEFNPFEAVHTNIIGAENVIQVAIRVGAEKVMAISTDKAVAPVNLYGATKLCAEKLFLAAHVMGGDGGPRFGVCRYGNVLSSRGSVALLFQGIKDNGGDHIPITDVRMTRFIITLDQAADFVLGCIDRMKGKEIFVPRIPSATIVDIHKAIAPDLPARIIGIRPGEKLHETLITEDERSHSEAHAWGWVIHRDFRYGPNCGYSSDNNDQWLSPEQLRELLG